MGTYIYAGKPQLLTVGNAPGDLAPGYYEYDVDGAQGGAGIASLGGEGGEIEGVVELTTGEQLEIVVGGAGAPGNNAGGGGGGGSFILGNSSGQKGNYQLLVAAGGGGGGGSGGAGYGGTQSGQGGAGGGDSGSYQAGRPGGSAIKGAAGGGSGYKGDGGSYVAGGITYSHGGSNRTGGYAGGAGVGGGGAGGFGGGGGGYGNSYGYGRGGGGGGYTGGNGGVGGFQFGFGFLGGNGNGASSAAKTPYGSGTNLGGINPGNGSVSFRFLYPIVCFAAGTLIRTTRGDVEVEALQVGDLAFTASGAARPVRWLGHRTIDCSAHPQPRDVWPIRVAAHAFGDGLPAADLFLSAGHSVRVGVVDAVLIPIGKLINGATIARHPVDEVTYWHVELDSHDVLIADGLPAESFLDCGNREGLVEQEGDYDRLAGSHTPADFCLPFVDSGEVLDATRALLAARAVRLGWATTHDMDMHLVVDGVRLDGDVDGDLARFFFPATAKRVVLASLTRTPADAEPSDDHRRLGISLHRLEFDDGLRTKREVVASDDRLADMVHPEDGDCHHRFTDGHLALPTYLWAGGRSQVALRVHHDRQGAARWIAPASVETNAGVFSDFG